MSSPSGDIYATQAQVARLEKVITQQQILIQELKQQKHLFLENIDSSIQGQLDEALAQRGTRGGDYLNITKFITKQIAAAILQIQDASVKVIQESLPFKTLQDLEKRLIAKPTATEDLRTISSRLQQLELQLEQGGIIGGGAPSEEVETLKVHVENLEKTLVQEVQKVHQTVHKPGELGGPLGRLQAKVEVLERLVKQNLAEDVTAKAEAKIVSIAATLKSEFTNTMEGFSSKELVEKLRDDVNRVGNLSKDVQTGYIGMRDKLNQGLEELTHRFSESRWKDLEKTIKTYVKETLKDSIQEEKDSIQKQEQSLKELLDHAKLTVLKLNSEVRSQYGPEMLEKHIQIVHEKVKAQQNEFQDILQEQILYQIGLMNSEYYSMKNQMREFTTMVKSELEASQLKLKYKEFEDQIQGYKKEFEMWRDEYEKVEQRRQSTLEFLNKYKQDLASTLLQTEKEMDGIKSSIHVIKKEAKDQLNEWIQNHQENSENKYKKTIKEVQQVRDSYLVLQQQIRSEIDEYKLKEKYNEFQNTLDLKLKAWLQEKDDYLIGRVVDVNQDVRELVRKAEAKEREMANMFSEENLRLFIQECETRLRASQEDWNKRRVEEFQLRYGEFDRRLGRMDELATVLAEREKYYDMNNNEKLITNFLTTWETKYDKSRTLFEAQIQQDSAAYREQISSQLAAITSQSKSIQQQLQDKEAIIVSMIENLKEKEKDVEKYFSKEMIERYIAEWEARLQISQNTWMRKKTEEFQTMFSILAKEIESSKSLVNDVERLEKKVSETVEIQSVDKLIQQCELRLKTAQDAWMKRKGEEWIQKFQDLEEDKKNLREIVKDVERTGLKLSATFNQQTMQKSIQEVESRMKINLDDLVKRRIEEYKIMQIEIKNQVELVRQISQQTYHDMDSLTKKYSSFETNLSKSFNQNTIKDISRQIEDNFKDIVSISEKSLKQSFDEWKQENHNEIKTTILKGQEVTNKMNLVAEKYKNYDKELNTLFNNAMVKFMNKERITELRQLLAGDILKDIKNNLALYAQLHLKQMDKRINEMQERVETFEMLIQSEVQQIKDRAIMDSGSFTKKDILYNSITKCFYTAIFGLPNQSVDDLAPIPTKLPGWDYICFTNLHIPPQKGWIIVKVEMESLNPILEAKRYKWMSHKYLGDYDLTVWMDAYIAPNPMFSELIKQWVIEMVEKRTYILHRLHEQRDCIYDECDAVVKFRRDTPERVSKVQEQLKELKFPKHWGLFDTNIIFKMHKNREIQDICEAVFQQLEATSYRDQLATPIIYYTRGFREYNTQTLLRAFDKSGTHVRITAK